MANKELEKKLNIAAYILSAIVLLLVGMMRRVKFDLGIDFSFLPPFHASLNGLAAIVLLLALYYIKKGDMEKHKRMIYIAMGLSAGFLISYVLYHFTTEETKFCKEGMIRKVYFFFLITHVVLAGVILPFIFLTFNRAFTGQYERHKKMARWVWPLWFYVAVTGPLLYLMLRPCYSLG